MSAILVFWRVTEEAKEEGEEEQGEVSWHLGFLLTAHSRFFSSDCDRCQLCLLCCSLPPVGHDLNCF